MSYVASRIYNQVLIELGLKASSFLFSSAPTASQVPNENDVKADKKKGLNKNNSSLNDFIKLKVSEKYKRKCANLS